MKRSLAGQGFSGLAMLTVAFAAACSSSPEERAPITAGGSSGRTAAAEVERDCFSVRGVSGFRIVDEDTVRLNVGPSTAYEVDAGGATCTSLRFANQIALEADPGSAFICVGDGPTTAAIRTDQGDACLIEAVRRAPPETPPSATAPSTAAPTATGGGAE